MEPTEFAKLASTPAGAALLILWFHNRISRVENRLDQIGDHLGAPRAKKSRFRAALMLAIASAAIISLTSGCAHVSVTRDGFSAITPAWPWQDSTRVIDRLNVSTKTNAFTASVRGLNESEQTSSNAVLIIQAVTEAAIRAAAKAP